MDIVKIIGIGICTLVIVKMLKEQKSELALYASLVGGIIILTISLDQIKYIIDLLMNLSSKANINKEFIIILVKITGIAILVEFAVNICKDAGENSIASKIDLGGKVIIISMSIPIISGVVESMMKILN